MPLPVLARNGPTGPVCRCPFIGVDRMWLAGGQTDATDPDPFLRIARLLSRVRIPLRQLGNVRVQKIPGMAARGVEDDGGLERHGTVEASDVDADEFGTLVRLVVDRDTAVRAKALSFRCTSVAGARDFANLT